MPPSHRPHVAPRKLFASGILVIGFALLFASISPASRAETATLGASPTPMAEATVDDVTIRLLSWEQAASFIAEIEIVNNSPDAIGVPQALMQFEATLADGAQVIRALHSSTPERCDLAPGAAGRMTLEFDSVEGQVPVSLQIGISEPYRSGARVVFPLNSNTGPSAFGGNALPGAPATPTSSAASSSPIATPAYECTD